jgi:hypothetical protein
MRNPYHLLRFTFYGQWRTLFHTWFQPDSYLVPTLFLAPLARLKFRQQDLVHTYLRCIKDDDFLVGGEEGGLVDVHGEGHNGPAILSVCLRRQSLQEKALKGTVGVRSLHLEHI